MESAVDPEFFELLNSLPLDARKAAKADFDLWKSDPFANGLHFKEVIPKHRIWSVRAGLNYRACGVKDDDGSIYWFFIGSHAEYDNLLSRLKKINTADAPKSHS